MNENSGHKATWNSKPWRIAAWVVAACVMLVPLSVQLTHGDFGWHLGDFVAVAIVLLSVCAIFDLAARASPNLPYLAGAGAGLAAGFGLFVVNGAVGLVGSEDEAHNVYFFVAIGIAIIGSFIAKGRAVPMSRTMLAAATSHIVVSAVLLIEANGVSDGDPLAEIIGLSIFALVWLASATFFQISANYRLRSVGIAER